ncbi:MAG: hypothetical protein ABL952_16385, partial [Pyrinomonadaceae bacterium]
QMGVEPGRIDIINKISGVDFEEASLNRGFVEIVGIAIPVIGKELLIRNKKATDRPKDKSDVEWLENE